jgi:hypothetical protein
LANLKEFSAIFAKMENKNLDAINGESLAEMPIFVGIMAIMAKPTNPIYDHDL